MNVNIQTQNFTLSGDIEDYAYRKLDKLERYLPNITSVSLELAHQKTRRSGDLVIVEITVRHARGAILRAEEKTTMDGHESIKVAINGAVDKMYSRIRRFKDKPRTKRLREAYKATPEELTTSEIVPVAELDYDPADVPDAEQQEPQNIRYKKLAVNAMNEEEAIEQMELLGHDFFVFFHAEANQMQVLYRRENGGYGILIPRLE